MSNEGFRPNAQLHVIMLSDECEQSPNPGICGTQGSPISIESMLPKE